MTSISDLVPTVQTLLTTTAAQAGRDSGLIQRVRVFTGARIDGSVIGLPAELVVRFPGGANQTSAAPTEQWQRQCDDTIIMQAYKKIAASDRQVPAKALLSPRAASAGW